MSCVRQISTVRQLHSGRLKAISLQPPHTEGIIHSLPAKSVLSALKTSATASLNWSYQAIASVNFECKLRGNAADKTNKRMERVRAV